MKRYCFYFYNSFTDEFLGSIELNWDRGKAMNGHYSNFWRKIKIGLSNLFEIDKRLVRLKIYKVRL